MKTRSGRYTSEPPSSLGPRLGVLPSDVLELVLSGLELAKQGKKLKDEPNLTVGYITAIVTLTLKTGIACIAGIAAALLMGGAEQLYAWFKEEWPKWMAKLSSKRGRFSNVKADECDSPPTPPAQDSPFSDATEGHDAQEAKPLS